VLHSPHASGVLERVLSTDHPVLRQALVVRTPPRPRPTRRWVWGGGGVRSPPLPAQKNPRSSPSQCLRGAATIGQKLDDQFEPSLSLTLIAPILRLGTPSAPQRAKYSFISSHLNLPDHDEWSPSVCLHMSDYVHSCLSFAYLFFERKLSPPNLSFNSKICSSDHRSTSSDGLTS